MGVFEKWSLYVFVEWRRRKVSGSLSQWRLHNGRERPLSQIADVVLENGHDDRRVLLRSTSTSLYCDSTVQFTNRLYR